MVASQVSGDAADHRSFNTAFGTGGTRGTCDDQRQRRASNKRIHVSPTPLVYFSIRTLKFGSPSAADCPSFLPGFLVVCGCARRFAFLFRVLRRRQSDSQHERGGGDSAQQSISRGIFHDKSPMNL
jgi:hypothetical protein